LELKVDDAINILDRTPATLRGLLSGLPAPWLEATEGADTFSPLDVLRHLIYGEETDWTPRLRIILEEGEGRPFTPFDRFGFREQYGNALLGELLDRFTSLREKNLSFLRGLELDPQRLQLTGTHPALGVVTVSQLLAAWVVHDLGHLKQVVRVLARQYREAVGPWREYLSILDRP
jgi:hypothetical protein